MRTAKTQNRLGGCPGWSESSLGAHSLCWFCRVVAHMGFPRSNHMEILVAVFRKLYVTPLPHAKKIKVTYSNIFRLYKFLFLLHNVLSYVLAFFRLCWIWILWWYLVLDEKKKVVFTVTCPKNWVGRSEFFIYLFFFVYYYFILFIFF